MTYAPAVLPSRRVELWYGDNAAQRRVTVFFRIILAIPQFIVLFFLGIAAFFVLVIGWFGALFTGRLPEFADTYLSGFIRWEIRVSAYMYLLTDEYPPFTLEDVEYPVRTLLPGRGPLNRVSVFFRIILAIPASFFLQIVQYGLSLPLLFFIWIVVVVSGRMPAPLYTAYSAVLRYQARFHSWFDMLTSEYAWGMFGDFVPLQPGSSPPPLGAVAGETTVAPPPVPPPAPPPVPPAQPPAQPYAYPGTGGTAQTPPPPPPPPVPGATPPPPAGWPPAPPAGGPGGTPGAMPPPSPWERTSPPPASEQLPSWGILVVQGAAKGWLIFAIVWGSLIVIGQNALQGHRNNNNTTSGLVMTAPAAAPTSSGSSHLVLQPPLHP